MVWEKNSGGLIGFIDLGDEDLNFATFKDTSQIATHVLVFLIRSIVNPLSFSLANFATSGITAFQLFPIFWRAVAILEITCNLKVIAAVADGASPNRMFFRMHSVSLNFSTIWFFCLHSLQYFIRCIVNRSYNWEFWSEKEKKIDGPFWWIGGIVGSPPHCLREVMRFPKISNRK